MVKYVLVIYISIYNPFMHSVAKWPNMLSKLCGVYTARFLKYVWPFSNMHEKDNLFYII